MKYGNLNFLEPSGPLQTCNGTDLPFTPIIVKNFSDVIISILSVGLISVEKSSAETPQRFEDLCERGKYIYI
jgi:hypothetical protein